MTQLQTARYERFLRRLCRLVGGNVLVEMQNDISPVITVEDPADAALLFWKGHRPGMSTSSIVASVTQFPENTLHNPAGSSVLIWIYGVIITRADPAVVVFGGIDTSAPGADNSLKRIVDTRDPQTLLGPSGVAIVAGTSVASFGTKTFQAEADLSGNLHVPHLKIVLAPGTGFFFGTDVDTGALRTAWFYIERTVEESELGPI